MLNRVFDTFSMTNGKTNILKSKVSHIYPMHFYMKTKDQRKLLTIFTGDSL